VEGKKETHGDATHTKKKKEREENQQQLYVMKWVEEG
jgi:hypothetical protein